MFIKFSFHCIIISFKNTYPRQGYLNNLVISIFRTFPSCAFYLTEVSTHQLTAINYQSVALLSLLKNIKQNQKKKRKNAKEKLPTATFRLLVSTSYVGSLAQSAFERNPFQRQQQKQAPNKGTIHEDSIFRIQIKGSTKQHKRHYSSHYFSQS